MSTRPAEVRKAFSGTEKLLGDKGVMGTNVQATPCVVDPFGSPRGFIKWVGPMLFVGFGGYIGSAGLHYASYNFVHEMDHWNASTQQLHGSSRRYAEQIEGNYTSNRDPVEIWLGPKETIPMGTLDLIAMLFPALFVLLMYATQRVEVWTKVMVCTALLAASKGIIGAVTTVPDSSGWETCRDAHLGAEGYAWLREDRSFFAIVTVDFWWLLTYGHPLRYCSDMMFSGHTFFVTLYALGLYEVALIWTHQVAPSQDCVTPIRKVQVDGKASDVEQGRVAEDPKDLKKSSSIISGSNDDPRRHGFAFEWSPGWRLHKMMINRNWGDGAKAAFRASVLIFVSGLAIGQQFCKIYYVLLSHFHYTSDVIVALMLTFLFYSNGAISIFAKQWALRDLHFLTAGHFMPKFYMIDDVWAEAKKGPTTLGERVGNCFSHWRGTLFPPKEAQNNDILKHWDYGSGVPMLKTVDAKYYLSCCCPFGRAIAERCHCCTCVFSPKEHIENPPYLIKRECKNCTDKNGHPQRAKEYSKYCRTCGKEFDIDSGLKEKALQNTWISRGDIFVPVCCFPCCCLAGRQHVYSDQGVDSFRFLINGDDDPTNDIGDDVVEQMHMHEGISEADAENIRIWLRKSFTCQKAPQNNEEKQEKATEKAVQEWRSKNKKVTPWAFSYAQPALMSFIAEFSEHKNNKGKSFKDEQAKVCPSSTCRQVYPKTDSAGLGYLRCVNCSTELKDEGKTLGEYMAQKM